MKTDLDIRNESLARAANLIHKAIVEVNTAVNFNLGQIDINNLGLITDRLVEAERIARDEIVPC